MQTELSLTSIARPSSRSWLTSPFTIVFGFTAAAVFIFAFNFYVLNNGMPNWWSDTYEYAVAASNLSEGKGLVTTAYYVLDTWLLRNYPLPQPYVHHDNGLPLWMGFIMYLFGSNAKAVGLTGGIAYILSVPLTFLLGYQVYNKTIGVLAALLALINIQLITYGVTGLSEVPYAFFMTLFLLTLYTARNRRMLFLAGALFGWLWVFRSNTMAALPWVLLFVGIAPLAARGLFRRSRRRIEMVWKARRDVLLRLAPFVIGMLLVLTPNFIRAYQTLGNPFYNINSMYALVFNTSAFDGKTREFLSDVAPETSPVEYILAHPDQLWSKATYQLPRQLGFLWNGGLSETPTVADALQILLLLLGAVIPRRGETSQQRLFRWMIYATILSAIALGSVTTLRWRHFYGYVPVLMILVAEVILRVTDVDWDRVAPRLSFLSSPILVMSVVTVVFGYYSVAAVQRTALAGQALDLQYRQMARWLRRTTPPDSIILIWRGDASYGRQSALAFYSNRETTELAPFTAEYFKQQRGEKNMYVMFVDYDSRQFPVALAETGLEDFKMMAASPLENEWHGALFAAP